MKTSQRLLRAIFVRAYSFLTGEIFIDCRSIPPHSRLRFTGDIFSYGFSIFRHHAGDYAFRWLPENLELYLDENQKDGICGKDLYRKISEKQILNACVLNWLLKNKKHIPREWRKYKGGVCFFGTIYRHYTRNDYVRCLYWDKRRLMWEYDFRNLDKKFNDSYRIVMLTDPRRLRLVGESSEKTPTKMTLR